MSRLRIGRKTTVDGMQVTEFPPQVREAIRLFGMWSTPSRMYRDQPAIRTVVDFLARNTAQLNPKLYERVSRYNRVELSDHGAMRLINRPNPETTRYELLFATVADFKLYDIAYWRRVRDRGRIIGLVRIPPSQLTPEYDVNNQFVARYRLSNGEVISRSDLVIFRGYDPESNASGTSPIRTLRQTLAEETAAGIYREWFWKNAARQEGVIERPVDAPEWDATARTRFLTEWENFLSGPQNSGKTGLLEDGMKWNASSFSPKESEWVAGRKLTQEEVARAYHIPLGMIGLLDNANFASMDEFHKQLYTETLAPDLTFYQQRLALELLPEFEAFDSRGVQYFKFNIEEKLRGDFEKQAETDAKRVGVPTRSVNDARADRDEPPIGDPDDPKNPFNTPVMPMNVIYGGQASPLNPVADPGNPNPPAQGPPPTSPKAAREKRVTDELLRDRDRLVEEHVNVLTKFFNRQRQVFKSAGRFDRERWNRELADDLYPLGLATATYFGLRTAKEIGGTYTQELTLHYWETESKTTASNVNQLTELTLLEPDADVDAVFDNLIATASQTALTRVTRAMNWAMLEVARQSSGT